MPDTTHSTTGDGSPETAGIVEREGPEEPGPSPEEQVPEASLSGNGSAASRAAAGGGAPPGATPGSNGAGRQPGEQETATEPERAEHPDPDLRAGIRGAFLQLWQLRSPLAWMLVAAAALPAAARLTPPGWVRALALIAAGVPLFAALYQTPRFSAWSLSWGFVGWLFLALCGILAPLGGLRLPGAVVGAVLIILGFGLALRPPGNDEAPEPTDDPLLKKIRRAGAHYSRQANRLRDQRTGYAIFTAVLAPLAVCVLACQLLIYAPPHGVSQASSGAEGISPRRSVPANQPDHEVEGSVLIAFELLILVLALSTGFLNVGSAHRKWIEARLRAELLRREEFLYRARVGPYLRVLGLDEAVDMRLDRLKAVRPIDLLPLEEANRPTWQHALEDARHRQHAPTDPMLMGDGRRFDPRQMLREYDSDRVDHQLRYYEGKSRSHRRLDAIYEGLARLSLIGAVVVAAFHLGELLSHGDLPPRADNMVAVAAVTLPPLGACFLALRTAFENHRLRRSFDDQAQQLAAISLRISDLLLRESDRVGPAFDHDARRLVLSTESLLSNELRRWWLIVDPDKPTAL